MKRVTLKPKINELDEIEWEQVEEEIESINKKNKFDLSIKFSGDGQNLESLLKIIKESILSDFKHDEKFKTLELKLN